MIANAYPRRLQSEQLAIRVKGLHKTYRCGTTATAVLRGVDLAVKTGECVYLAGPSGSGKTTLLSILGCILSPDSGPNSGEVQILGQSLSALSEQQRVAMRRNRLGFVFQRFHLIRGLTVLQNVCVPLTLQGTGSQTAHRRAMTLLEAVGLTPKANVHPRNLSAGQCQRVALARALAGNPDIILADEPTASLDAQNGQEVMALLRRLTTHEGKTAVVVTHDQRILHFADRVFWLDNGRVAQTEKPPSTPPAESEERVSWSKQYCLAQ